MTLFLTIMIFLSFMAMLAIGVMFSREPLKGGGCCKASDVDSITKNNIKNRTDT